MNRYSGCLVKEVFVLFMRGVVCLRVCVSERGSSVSIRYSQNFPGMLNMTCADVLGFKCNIFIAHFCLFSNSLRFEMFDHFIYVLTCAVSVFL